jgi:hypothetical protein
MTFIAAGTALAAGVGLGASTAAVAAGTAIAAGATGAALGATGAAITGGDVGEGALMGGVSGAVGGGLGAGLGAAGMAGSMGANIAAGGIAGAAGGAAGSAAGGQDIGKGALVGGALGGIGGYLKGVAPTAGETPNAAGGMTQESSAALAKQEAASTLANTAKVGPSIVGDEGVYSSMRGAAPAAQASQVAAPAVAQFGTPSGNLGSSFKSGMASIADSPMSAVKAGAPMLIGGMINGQVEPEPYVKPKSNYVGGASLSKDFKPYWADPQLYADGGAVDSMQTQQPMNKFYEQGLQMAQLAQQQAQQVAPQGIAQVAPQGVTQTAPAPAVGIGYANGGLTGDNLGGYSHGGIAGLTRGPGDGVSDDIPAEIGASGKQPARLADGEFVISSRIVSELGNGSTEAGAKRLQAMVDRVQSRREKSIGKGKVAVDSKSAKELIA